MTFRERERNEGGREGVAIRRGSKKGHYSPSFVQFLAFQHQDYRQNYIESELRVLKVTSSTISHQTGNSVN